MTWMAEDWFWLCFLTNVVVCVRTIDVVIVELSDLSVGSVVSFRQ
jgi:hypothetical protein